MVAGDSIVSIDGAAVSGLRISEVSRRMRGEPGSIVILTLMGPAARSLRQVRVHRAPIHSATVKLTVARYFTPNGREIQGRGITPDVPIASGAANGVALRESDLANHLAPILDSSAPPRAETVAGKRGAAERTNTFGTPGDKALKAAVAALAPPSRLGAPIKAVFRRAKALFDG